MNMNTLFKELYTEKYGDKIAPELAHELVNNMAVTDGSSRMSGEKWTVEDAVNMAFKVNADLSKIGKCEWYLVLNMLYSDYYDTVKRHALPETFYGEMALDWFNDVDQEEGKTFNYFMHL